MVKRIILLAALSLCGISLLAPLAARSAIPAPVELDQGLLPATQVPPTTTDRSLLSDRGGAAAAPSADAPEALAIEAAPTPGTASMEATLYAVATAPPPPPPPPAVTAAPRPAAATYSGGSVWDDLARCESGGNWAINTGNGYYGGLQFNHGTWHDYGGGEFAEYPHEASREEQIVVAERLRAARGYGPWPACRVKLGLP